MAKAFFLFTLLILPFQAYDLEGDYFGRTRATTQFIPPESDGSVKTISKKYFARPQRPAPYTFKRRRSSLTTSRIKDFLLKSDNSSYYYPTPHSVRHWFDLINKDVFNEEINFASKLIINKAKNLGWVEHKKRSNTCTLCLRQRYANFNQFLNVLGHEMVHMWQLTVARDTGDHNRMFYKWSSTFAKHGLCLQHRYEEDIPVL